MIFVKAFFLDAFPCMIMVSRRIRSLGHWGRHTEKMPFEQNLSCDVNRESTTDFYFLLEEN